MHAADSSQRMVGVEGGEGGEEEDEEEEEEDDDGSPARGSVCYDSHCRAVHVTLT